MDRACCISVCQDCDELTPNVQLNTTVSTLDRDTLPPNPGPVRNNPDGTIRGTFQGLIQRYMVRWLDLNNDPVLAVGTFVRGGLLPGVYSFELTSLTNPTCKWVFDVRVETELFAAWRVFYRGDRTDEVPKIASYVANPPDPNVTDYRINSTRILQTRLNTSGTSISFEVEEVGTAVVTYLWEDFTQYGTLPIGMNQQPTPQTAVVVNYPTIVSKGQPVVRPPLIQGPRINRIVLLHLVPTNGNGWIRLTMTTNTGVINKVWIYVKQQIIP